MSDDGGICWFQTVAEEEEQEYLEWLDKIESEKAMTQPVNASEKENEDEQLDCK